MASEPATVRPARARRESGPGRRFTLHVLEMLAVMFAGMGIFSGLAALAFMAGGSGLGDQPGWFRVGLMGVNMAVPMALWMAYRGHSAARNLEMAASMLVPAAGAAALTGAGAVGTGAAMTLEHVVMIPAMIGVMLWRREEYSHPHDQPHRPAGVRSATQ